MHLWLLRVGFWHTKQHRAGGGGRGGSAEGMQQSPKHTLGKRLRQAQQPLLSLRAGGAAHAQRCAGVERGRGCRARRLP
eukprot:1161979-Pelagomonas_calceolata.AAC.7